MREIINGDLFNRPKYKFKECINKHSIYTYSYMTYDNVSMNDASGEILQRETIAYFKWRSLYLTE
jgi:hypothetical protein